MKISELYFEYPEELVAKEPKRPSRVLFSDPNENREVSFLELLNLFKPGDLLVINDTKVEPRRVFAKSESGENLEVLFIDRLGEKTWSVLFPARRLKKNERILFDENISAILIKSGIPQHILLSEDLSDDFFEKFGEMPLPPYIQKSRGERHNLITDKKWYQTEWAKNLGSSAAPTASLHFSNEHIEFLRQKGVQVETLTLHVGLGTFLPVTVEDLNQHKMHSEKVEISKSLLEKLEKTKSSNGRVIALGTTVTRALESIGIKKFSRKGDGSLFGETDLLIQEGFEFRYVDVLLTNFHQPQSTLLALVMAFAGKKRVIEAYKFAIEHRFRLFSYGDLSVWFK